MGPELMLVSAVASAAATGLSAVATSNSMKAQAKADRQAAATEAAWTERRAKEETAGAQRKSADEIRKARLMQSSLLARAGASGTKVDDPTVMELYQDIEGQGQYNAAMARTAGDQTATGMRYQSGLKSWAADANARIKNYGAYTTLLTGAAQAAGQGLSGYGKYETAMGARYGTTGGRSGTGYG